MLLRQHIQIHSHKALKLHQNHSFRFYWCFCVVFSVPFEIPCHKINTLTQIFDTTMFFLDRTLLVQMILKWHFILFCKQSYIIRTKYYEYGMHLQTISMCHFKIVNLYFKCVWAWVFVNNHNSRMSTSMHRVIRW